MVEKKYLNTLVLSSLNQLLCFVLLIIFHFTLKNLIEYVFLSLLFLCHD